MANVLEGWVDKVDGIDDVKASDVNALANAIKQLGALGYLSPYPNTTTGTWWGINATTGQYQDTGVLCKADIGELVRYTDKAKESASSAQKASEEAQSAKTEAVNAANSIGASKSEVESNANLSKGYLQDIKAEAGKAKGYSESAKTEASRAKREADRASNIAGGDFATKTELKIEEMERINADNKNIADFGNANGVHGIRRVNGYFEYFYKYGWTGWIDFKGVNAEKLSLGDSFFGTEGITLTVAEEDGIARLCAYSLESHDNCDLYLSKDLTRRVYHTQNITCSSSAPSEALKNDYIHMQY